MSVITPHTSRAAGTILTAAVYNEDHLNHISNASTLNTDKMEGTPPPVVDGHAVVWNGVAGNAVRSAGFSPISSVGPTFTGSLTVDGTIIGRNLELRALGGDVPFIDFSNDAGDNDVRIILLGDDSLEISGCSASGLTRSGSVLWDDDNFDIRVAALSGGGTTNFLRADGTWNAPPAPPPPEDSITLGTEQATTSGTFKDFTGIPAGVKRITVMINNLSYTTNSRTTVIQLGDAGGIETTGYGGGYAGFYVGLNPDAADVCNAVVQLDLMNASGNKWFNGGVKSLSGVLDRVRVTSNEGATFDAGLVNISYES